jgi:hypothetical protein
MQEMDAALHTMLDENDALKAAFARVQGRLDNLVSAFEKNGSLGIWQAIANDPTLPIEIRLRAANFATPYERPKLSMTATATVPKLIDLWAERERRERLIEAKALDHDGPPDAA